MSLKLIGAGFGRTGTLSLKVALEQLGYGPCHHMTEVMMSPESAANWIRAAEGNPDWETIFAGYAATVDFPGCTFWRELAEHYPEAKVLLSVRDPEKWFESTQATIFSERLSEMIARSPMKDFMRKVVWDVFDGRIRDRDFMLAAFKRHNAEVEAAIPKERLLVYQASEGWAPLCRFLNVPVPDTPFPHANSREESPAVMAAGRTGDPNAALDFDALQNNIKTRLRAARRQVDPAGDEHS